MPGSLIVAPRFHASVAGKVRSSCRSASISDIRFSVFPFTVPPFTVSPFAARRFGARKDLEASAHGTDVRRLVGARELQELVVVIDRERGFAAAIEPLGEIVVRGGVARIDLERAPQARLRVGRAAD